MMKDHKFLHMINMRSTCKLMIQIDYYYSYQSVGNTYVHIFSVLIFYTSQNTITNLCHASS
jgi:hypothetical protein